MNSLMTFLLIASAKAAVLVVLVLLANLLLSRWVAARWRYLLWGLVALRLVLPPCLPSETSLFNLLAWKKPAVQEAVSELIPAGKELTFRQPQADSTEHSAVVITGAETEPSATPAAGAERTAMAQATKPSAATTSPVPRVPLVPAPASVSQIRISALTVFFGLWLSGMLMLLAIMGSRYWRLMTLIRRQAPVSDPAVLALFAACKSEMKITVTLPMVETAAVQSPALLGVFRPRLLLPLGMAQSLPPEGLRHVFLHELAHLRSRDVAANWLAALVQTVHWFNPLIWLAFRRMRQDQELACDETVLATLSPEDRRRYGHTLVDLTDYRPKPALAGVVGIVENFGILPRRLQMIGQYQPRNRIGHWLAALILLGLGAVSLTDAVAQVPTAAPVRFYKELAVPGGLVVVSSREVYPSSLGGYSVMLYGPLATPSAPQGVFLAGCLRQDGGGGIEKAILADIDGDGKDDVVVWGQAEQRRSVSAFSFDIRRQQVTLLAELPNLDPGADPVARLRQAMQKEADPEPMSGKAAEAETANVLKTIQEYLTAIKQGDGQKLAGLYASMKGMTPAQLAQRGYDQAGRFKGLDSGMTYDKSRTRVAGDLAVSFPQDEHIGPLFLVKEAGAWKLIVDWSLPYPVKTTYDAGRIKTMMMLSNWGKEERAKEAKANHKPAAPDLSRYPQTKAFKDFTDRTPTDNTLLDITAFDNNDWIAHLYTVTEKGEAIYVREVYDWTHQNVHCQQLSATELTSLREAIRQFPATNAYPPIARLVIVRFREGANWTSRSYDSQALPEPMRRIYGIVGKLNSTTSDHAPHNNLIGQATLTKEPMPAMVTIAESRKLEIDRDKCLALGCSVQNVAEAIRVWDPKDAKALEAMTVEAFGGKKIRVRDLVKTTIAAPVLPEGPGQGSAAVGNLSWIGDTPTAKELVALGFARKGNSFIYAKDMPFGEFKRVLEESPLKDIPSLGDGEWIRTTTVKSNHTVLEWKKNSVVSGNPTDTSIIHVTVNLELKRRPSISVGDPVEVVEASLIHLGARKVKMDERRPGMLGSQWYILPDGTCLKLRVESCSTPGGKPSSPVICEILLGESGQGYANPKDWDAQAKTSVKTLSLSKYRKALI